MTVKDVFVKAYPIKLDAFASVLHMHYDFDEERKLMRGKVLKRGRDPENDMDIIACAYDDFMSAYSDILKTEPVLHPECVCTVYPVYWEDNIYTADYDVSCINRDEILKNYKETGEVHSYSELLEGGAVPLLMTYGIMFEKREDILGYEMAQASLDRYPLKDLVAALYWELTWFGCTNEECDRNRKKEEEELTGAIKEMEEDKKSGGDKLITPDDSGDLFTGMEEIEFDDDLRYQENEKKAAVRNYNEAAEYFRELYWDVYNEAHPEEKNK